MNFKIAQLEEIKKQVQELVENDGDFCTLDSIFRRIKLLTKRFFSEKSEYLVDIKKIEGCFPTDSGPVPEISNDELEYRWVGGCEKLENLLNVMIEDLEMPQTSETIQEESKVKQKSVFIVHGTDYEPVKQLKSILQEVGIEPIILHEQPSKGMTIIEKLEQYSNVGYAFIVLTPDDLGLEKKAIQEYYKAYNEGKEYLSKQDINNFLGRISRPIGMFLLGKVMEVVENRARQNVILEFGYFIGRIGRSKVCCLYKGDIELPSDMHGICYLHFNDSVNEVKDAIIAELEAANLINRH